MNTLRVQKHVFNNIEITFKRVLDTTMFQVFINGKILKQIKESDMSNFVLSLRDLISKY